MTIKDGYAPRISIVVRTMGRPELGQAIASVLGQSWPNVEIVIVVANPEFSPRPEFAHPAIKIVKPGIPLLRPAAGNAGLEAATGKWIGFLDEDDIHEPDHAKTLVEAALASDALLAYGDLIVHEGDKPSYVRSSGYWKRQHTGHPIPHLISTLFARPLIDKFKCRFDTEFDVMEDWDFFIQCAEFTDFLHVEVPVAHYKGYLGMSGCGSGPNRDPALVKAGVEKMTAKWGTRYGTLIVKADGMLRNANEAIENRDWRAAELAVCEGLAVDPGNPLLLNRLALCRKQAGDSIGVLKALRRACDSDRGAFSLHCQLAVLEHRLGFIDRSTAVIARLRTMAATDDERAQATQLEKMLLAQASAVGGQI